jgi:hypothetical protein
MGRKNKKGMMLGLHPFNPVHRRFHAEISSCCFLLDETIGVTVMQVARLVLHPS